MLFSLENRDNKELEFRKNSIAAIKKWIREKIKA
jgi:hypothetical protein